MAESLPPSKSNGQVSQQPLGKSKEVEDFNKWCDDPIFGEQTWIGKKSDDKEPTTEEKFGATWDWVISEGKVSEAIRISDPSYERLVNTGDVFKSCVHYAVPIHCGCNKEVFTLVCQKCMLHFCSDPCMEQNLRGKGGLSESAIQKLRARKQQLQRTGNGNNPINRTHGPQRKDGVAIQHSTRNYQNGPQRNYPVGSQQIQHTTPVKLHHNPSETVNNSSFERQRQNSRHEEKHPILEPNSTKRVELVLRDRDPMQHNNNNLHHINPDATNAVQQTSLLGAYIVNTSVPPPNMGTAGAEIRNYNQNGQNNISMKTSVMPRKMPPSQFNSESDRLGKDKDNKKNPNVKQKKYKERLYPTQSFISTRGAHRKSSPPDIISAQQSMCQPFKLPPPINKDRQEISKIDESNDITNSRPLTLLQSSDCFSSSFPSGDRFTSSSDSGDRFTSSSGSGDTLPSSLEISSRDSSTDITDTDTDTTTIIVARGARRPVYISSPPDITSAQQSMSQPFKQPPPINKDRKEINKIEKSNDITNSRPMTLQQSSDCFSFSPPSGPSRDSSTNRTDTTTTIIGRGRGRGRQLHSEETQKESIVEVSLEVEASPDSGENKLEDLPISDSNIATTIRVETPIEKPFCPPLLSTFEMGCIYVKTPHMLSLCTSESRRVSKTLLEEIKKLENLEKAGNIQPGDYVLAPYCEGETVNRAKILEVLKQRTVSIYYIDFGITDEVAQDSLCKLPENLQNFPPNAIRFSLSNVKQPEATQRHWSKEGNELVNTLCELKTVRCVVKYVAEIATGLLYIGEIKIKQSHKWVDVGEQMIGAGLAEKMSESFVKALVEQYYWNDYPMQLFPESSSPELALNTRMKVDLSHVNDLQDFYVTTVKEKQDRERLMSKLNKIMLYPEMCSIFLPQEEPIGVAFIEKQWWRVKVTLIRMDQTVDVFLIDKGETVKKSVKLNTLRKYPDHLPRDKAYAYHCQLPIVPVNSTHWDSNLIQNLKKVQHQQESPEVKCFHIENGIHTVELYSNRASAGWSHNLILIKDAKEPFSMKNAEFLQKSHSKDQHQTQTPGPVTQGNNSTRQTSPFSQTETDRSQNTEILNKDQAKVNNEPEQQPDEKFSGNGLSDISPAELNIKHLAAAPKLSTLLKEKVQFSVYLTKMWGIVYIVPKGNQRNEINEIVKNFATHYRNYESRKPKDLCFKKEDVVCVKINDKDVRAVMDLTQGSETIVRLLDYGEFERVPTCEIMPVSQEIMKFPPSGYSIKLPNVTKNMKLLSSKYKLLEEKLNKSIFILDTVQGPHPLDPMTTVATLRNADESIIIGDNSLTDLIASYEKMAWELYFDGGYTTTSDIITKGGKWPVQTIKQFYNLEQEVPLNKPMSSIVLRAFVFEEDLMVVLLRPNSEELVSNLKIISNKMESFYHKVKVGSPNLSVNSKNSSTSFVAVRIAHPSDIIKKVFGNPKWHRFIKSGNNLLSLDYHAEWLADSDGHLQITEIRKMCPEFLEIPSACILAKISGIDMNIESSKLATEQVFSLGCRPKFILTSADKEDGEKTIYEMKCPVFENLIFNL